MATIDENLRRVPPQSLEAEESVLGGIMLDNTVIDRVIGVLQPDDFYRGAHRKVFRAMMDLTERSEPVDLITLSETLKARGQLAEVGGAAYLAELTERVPTAANAAHYAKIVRERSILRGLIEASTEIATRGYQAPANVDELLDHAEQLIFGIQERKVKQAFAKLSEVLVESIKTIERLYEQKQAVTGVPTGFADLDALTAGLQPSDLIVVAGRPSMGKCLAADAEIVLADGSVRTIEEIVQARSARLLTLTDRWRLVLAEPAAFVDDGFKPVFEVTTRLGRRVRTTLSHPFLTVDGWKPLGELRAGDHVAIPRRIDAAGEGSLGEERVKILAYLLGDGTLTGPCPGFTNSDPRLRADFRDAVARFGGLATREDTSGGRAPTVVVSSDRREIAERRARFGAELRRNLAASRRSARDVAARVGVTPGAVTYWCAGQAAPRPATFRNLCVELDLDEEELAPGGLPAMRKSERNRLTRWLESLGLWGKTACEKFIPEPIFTLRRDELACFLNRLFATDGWATVLASGQAQLGFCSTSERMARQMQHLLLRFGVIASLRRRLVKYGGDRPPAFQLDITDAESIRAFDEEIGIFGKEAALAKVRAALARKKYQTNRDLIPAGVWRHIDAARQGATWRSIGLGMGLTDDSNLHVGRRALSRRRLAAFARALGDSRLHDLATSDVYWDEIVSIEPRGLGRVYDLTIPGTHNFVANDVCVHNTAFCLNIAEHAALRTDTGVAIFSLEMAKEQLAMRMLCSEARVDLARVRTGHLSDREFPKLAMAAGRLGDAPIYIDDTPALSVLELRAKARRLKRDAAAKLGLVIVDYIQLMRSSEGKDNREQEISEISRSLKALAKELRVPVVALSQLNRQVENRTPPVPRLADLRECVTGDTLVMLGDGRRVPIAGLVGSDPRVLAMSVDGHVVEARSDRVWRVGRKPVFRVTLATGRTVTATARHRLRSGTGWSRVGELRVGDRIAAARSLPEPQDPVVWPDGHVVLLGQLIGDGSYLEHQPLRYTTSSEENSVAVADAARECFGNVVRRYAGRGTWHQLLLSGNGNRWRPAGVNAWLRSLGIFGQRSGEKRIPVEAFRLSNRQVGLLLQHLWATDGCIWVPPEGGDHAPRVYYGTTSAGLAADVAALLLRFGITARTYRVSQGTSTGYSVSVSGSDQQRRFLEHVGSFGPRRVPAERLARLLARTRANTNVDTLPRERFRLVKQAMQQRGLSQRAMASLRGTAYGGTAHFRFAPSRVLLAEYARILEEPALLAESENEVFWDRVIAIEPAGEADVFDLTVPGPACWLADGIVSHNSGAIEQDADVICFLYRDEYYNPEDTEKQGVAEVHIAKQRNGPVGKIELTFLKEYTRFENRELAPEDVSGGDQGSALH